MNRPTFLVIAALVVSTLALASDGAPVPPAGTEGIDAAIAELHAVRERLGLLLLEAPDMGGFAAADVGRELAAAAWSLRGIGHSLAPEPGREGRAGATAPADLSDIAEGAGDVARLVRGASEAWPAAGCGPALDEVAVAADQLLFPIGLGLEALRKKVIPLRFVEVSSCSPGTPACERYMDREALVAGQDAMNQSYAPAGLAFWVKAVDRYQMDHFASTTAPIDTSVTWSTAKSELGRAIHLWDPNPVPANRTYQQRVDYVTTVFADPSELLVWLFDGDSVVKRVHGQKSYGQFPHQGRAPVLTW